MPDDDDGFFFPVMKRDGLSPDRLFFPWRRSVDLARAAKKDGEMFVCFESVVSWL